MDTDWETVRELSRSLEVRHSDAMAAVQTLLAQRKTLQGQVRTLQGQVRTLQGQVRTLQGQVRDQVNAAQLAESRAKHDREALDFANREAVEILRRERDEAIARSRSDKHAAALDLEDARKAVNVLLKNLIRSQELSRALVEERDEARAEAKQLRAERTKLASALGICGSLWLPMTGDGQRCEQVCSLAAGHKGAHGWGANVQATTV